MKARAVLDLVPGWAWALLLAGALVFAGVSRVQLAGARVATAEARTATPEARAGLAAYQATAAESARLADRVERAEEARRTETQRRPSMKPNPKALRPWLTATMLALLTSACSNVPPNSPPPPVQPARVPTLPSAARQPVIPSECLPTCSAGAASESQSWLNTLTVPE